MLSSLTTSYTGDKPFPHSVLLWAITRSGAVISCGGEAEASYPILCAHVRFRVYVCYSDVAEVSRRRWRSSFS
ncbi:unnamed protein product [Amoebophrya sp. A25]|nr:unnamed protein product [Amoebophrya sp. A25]|eukprot:GSA25T00000694001.1